MQTAVSLADELQNSPSVEVMTADSKLIRDSFSLYRQRPDKSWRLTDCSSFILMRELGLTKAIAYDSHFDQGWLPSSSPRADTELKSNISGKRKNL